MTHRRRSYGKPASRLHQVAPRLAKALDEEHVYQARLRDERRRGIISLPVAEEELARSVRKMKLAP